MTYRDDLIGLGYTEGEILAYERCWGNDSNEDILKNFVSRYVGTYADNNAFATANANTAGPLPILSTETDGWACVKIAVDEASVPAKHFWKSGTTYFLSV